MAGRSLNRRDYQSAIPQLEKSMKSLTDYIRVSDGKVQIKIEDLYGKVGTLTVTAEEISGTVENLSGDVAVLAITAEEISGKVETIESDYVTSSELTLTAQGLELEISDKAEVFTSQPTPPYAVGDLWVQGPSGDIMRCSNARTSGNYVATDWEPASEYTDDTRADSAYNLADSAYGVASNEVANRKAIVRTTTSGTLTCYQGATKGVLVNASGYVDIVSVSWNGTTPTAGSYVARYGSNVIQLGYDSTTAKVSLCNDNYWLKGSDYAVRLDSYTRISAGLLGVGNSSGKSSKGVELTTLSETQWDNYNNNSTLPTGAFSSVRALTVSSTNAATDILCVGTTTKTIGPTTGRKASFFHVTEDFATLVINGVYKDGMVQGFGLDFTWSSDDTVAVKASGKLGTQFGIDNPTGSSNCHITQNGFIYKASSSSRRYKREIEKISDPGLDPRKLYDLPVSQFRYKDGYIHVEEGETYDYPLIPGFIAEDVYEHYSAAAEFEKGEVETWDVKKIVPPMLALIQEQNDRITELERKIA